MWEILSLLSLCYDCLICTGLLRGKESACCGILGSCLIFCSPVWEWNNINTIISPKEHILGLIAKKTTMSSKRFVVILPEVLPYHGQLTAGRGKKHD